jgi:hypothetical protein
MEKKEQYFEVGMTVWDAWGNEGKVERIMEMKVPYPVLVKFNNESNCCYSSDGIDKESGRTELYQTKPIITPNVPLIRLEKGELVFCRESKNGVWDMRYFSHKDEIGFWCFNMQLKEGNVSCWYQLRKINDNPLLDNNQTS